MTSNEQSRTTATRANQERKRTREARAESLKRRDVCAAKYGGRR